MAGELLTYIGLVGAGFIAGAVNAIAGGGTFFTFPVLIWAGLPPFVANATNMIALTPSNVAALPAFRAQLLKLKGVLLWPSVVGILGGGMGAILVLALGAYVFAQAVPYLMATATALFAFAPTIRKWISKSNTSGFTSWSIGSLMAVFVFSIYGGYFGAGLGQILLAATILIGFSDLHEANAIKNLVVSAVSLTALVIFGLSGAVHWPFAAVMAVSSAVGGYFGGRLSQAIPQTILRLAIIAFGVFLTGYYFLRGA